MGVFLTRHISRQEGWAGLFGDAGKQRWLLTLASIFSSCVVDEEPRGCAHLARPSNKPQPFSNAPHDCIQRSARSSVWHSSFAGCLSCLHLANT